MPPSTSWTGTTSAPPTSTRATPGTGPTAGSTAWSTATGGSSLPSTCRSAPPPSWSPCGPAPTTGSPPRPGASWPSGGTPVVVPDLKRLLAADRDETVALRDLWALHVSGGLDDATAMGLLDHPVAGVRRWTIRLLGDDHRMNREPAGQAGRPGGRRARRHGPRPARLELPAMGRRRRAADPGRLVRHDADRGDPHIPNLLWWAFERQLRQDRDAVVDLLSDDRGAADRRWSGTRSSSGRRGPWPRRVPTATSRRVPGCWRPRRDRSRRRGSWPGWRRDSEGRKLARGARAARRAAVAALGRGAARRRARS